MNAFAWATDAITVQFAQVKTKKDGKKILLKHVYANPFQPEVVPRLPRLSRLPRLPEFLSIAPITPIATIGGLLTLLGTPRFATKSPQEP